MKRPLKTAELEHFDGGRLAETLDGAMKEALVDCEDRPGLKKARTVTLTFQLTPLMHDSECEAIVTTFKVEMKKPPQESGTHTMQARRNGVAVFDDLIDDARQLSIEDE